jgi:hypothetical protein
MQVARQNLASCRLLQSQDQHFDSAVKSRDDGPLGTVKIAFLFLVASDAAFTTMVTRLFHAS